MSDIKAIPTESGLEISLINNDLCLSGGLKNAVFLSLFTGPYWGNSISSKSEKFISTITEIIENGILSNKTRLDVEEAAKTALQWMKDDKIVNYIVVKASIPASGTLYLSVTLSEPDQKEFVYSLNWDELKNSINTETVEGRSLDDYVEPIPILFISTWNTNPTGGTIYKESNSNQIKLPLDENGTYDFSVDWGDGNTDEITSYNQDEILHTYSEEGIYDISIEGECTGFGFNRLLSQDNSKLINVKDWGEVRFHNNGGIFYHCNKLTGFSATNAPRLSNITTFLHMFNGCSLFDADLSSWDTSTIDNMGGAFNDCGAFNGDVSTWDVSNVTSFSQMFYNAKLFNQDISGWNPEKLTEAFMGFGNCSVFDQNLGNWNIENATMLYAMLNSSGISTENYSQTLIGWSSQDLKSNVSLGASGLKYDDSAVAARDVLVNTFNWNISDGGNAN